jgi:phosphatidylserine/phosphatidylglycerophosphate/cardiolipin synthase-like enzyme
MAATGEAPSKHLVPVQRGQYSATFTPPWFVNKSEYTPKLGAFELLVNGKQAFGEVYRAIEAAKKSVSIICWGFQPSMYFVRDRSGLSIGALLEKKAREGVEVRVLGWTWSNKPVAAANWSKLTIGENNTPGRRWVPFADKPDSSSDQQHEYDRWWYLNYDRNPLNIDALARLIGGDSNLPRDRLKFYSRSFGALDSVQIAGTNFLDPGLSPTTKTAVSATTSHHQKTVVIDHDDPELATAFVMGHNMLDGYWDTPDHGYARQAPDAGRNGGSPLHDYSSRVSGLIIGDVFRNFAAAWTKETGEDLAIPDFSKHEPRSPGARAVCQILRTQPQYGRQDIMKCYLQAVSNAGRYIHIENQYFRWPPLAERIKSNAAKYAQGGRTPEQHGPLYLFVITNSSDTGMGVGTVNTYRMLDSLGRADRIPQVARQQRMESLDAQIEANQDAMKPLLSQRNALDSEARMLQGMPNPGLNSRYEPINAKLAPLEAKQRELEEAKAKLEVDTGGETIQAVDVPGLKMHVATLVAPDTPAGKPWPEVYIHAKLMLVDDTFMTLGSANINTRSMQADSEINIAHHRPEITAPVREEQWAKYTSGRVVAGSALDLAYEQWQELMTKNAEAKKYKRRPLAQLCEFLRASPAISNKD